MEIEIKLNVRPTIEGGPVMLFLKLSMIPELAGRPLGEVIKAEIRDLYYDTEDGKLAAAGAGLRLRIVNGVPFVTLKLDKFQDGALVSREEFQEPVEQERLDWVLSHVRHLIGEGEVSAESFQSGKPVGPLVPVLEARTARLVRVIGDHEAELVMDMIEYPGYSINPYFDIEVESTSGEAGLTLLRAVETELYRIAGGDLAPANLNKLERGLKLKAKAKG